MTRDPALYADLAGTVRDRSIPSLSLLPGQRIPSYVAVVLTSPQEAASISHRNVIAVPEDGDRRSLWAAVESSLYAREKGSELTLGIDPGPRPGYAVYDGAECVGAGVLESPESSAELASQLRRRFPDHRLLIRVGGGDHLARDRIVNSLLPLRRPVEIVDEQGTTPRGKRRPSDLAAAKAIARTPGTLVREQVPLWVTQGEITNLQRESRERSGSQFTISRAEAHRVLRGELTLAQAVQGHELAARVPRSTKHKGRQPRNEPS